MATPPVFSAGAVLTAAQMNAVGLWEMTPTSVSGTGGSLSGSTVTVTNSTSVSVNGCFTSDFDNYRLVVSQITANTPQGVYIRLRTTTDANTNYNYGGIYRLFVGGGGDVSNNGQAQFVICTASTTPDSSCVFDIFSPNLAKQTQFMGFMSNFDAGVAIAGNHTTASAYTGLTFLTTTGNTFSAKIRIYGYRN